MDDRIQIGAKLQLSFFEKPCLEVARALIGMYLLRRLPDGETAVGRVVETEAYLGDGTDPGAHSHRGRTPRNAAMFGPAGSLYVYVIYGVHLCANVVCEGGRGSAVLLRAVEPMKSIDGIDGINSMDGIEKMRTRRGLAADAPRHQIANGPAKLCQAFGIDQSDDERSVTEGPIVFHKPDAPDPAMIVGASRRIGLSHGRDLPYRFFEVGNPCVSGPRSMNESDQEYQEYQEAEAGRRPPVTF